ncbi:hypothetical protein niasHT_012707 [Heterodera trifolii]|uniref:Uncharacterized protein n=1 Tax=Heterodera trifolii TaxID=157864 RepID=A0ABD2L760_9BILA
MFEIKNDLSTADAVRLHLCTHLQNVDLVAENDQFQATRAPKKPGRTFLSACDESNGTPIERPISAQSSGQQQIVLDNPKVNSLKTREAMDTADISGNATADAECVGNGTADAAMSTTSSNFGFRFK